MARNLSYPKEFSFPLVKPASHTRTPTRTGAFPSGEHQGEASGGTQLSVQEISDVLSQNWCHRHKYGDGGQNPDLTIG